MTNGSETLNDSPICLFNDELDALIEHYRSELPVGSIIGSLHVAAHNLCSEAAFRDVLAQQRNETTI